MLAKEVEHQTNQDSELDPRLIAAHPIVTLAAFHTLNNSNFSTKLRLSVSILKLY
jgi:hypothetical protein